MADTTDILRAVDLPRYCSASTLVTLLRSYAKAEREKSINSTRREPKIMHSYAANRLEAILLAVGVSKDEPNVKTVATCATGDTNEAKDA